MRIRARALVAAAALAIVATPGSVSAQTSWTDWTSSTAGNAGSALGTLMVDLSPVIVRYSGEVFGATTQTSGGTDYWSAGNAYDATGHPTGTDIIALTGGKQITQTISFDTPVLNPILAILSLGQPSLIRYYEFSAPFTILSSGCGFWGGDCAGSLFTTATAGELKGVEGHGVIQFSGTYSSISWTVPEEEIWHGFQVGVTATPEPASLLLLGTGLIGVFGVARRRRNG